MSRSARKSVAPTKPLIKRPVQIGSLDTAALVGTLRQLHEDAEDESVGRMPADEELFGALLHLETNAGALKTVEARREAAITRVRLWEYLREQTDLHQARAIRDARAANAQWADLAPALAVRAPSAAYNKAKRLQAAVLTKASPGDGPPVRRTPEAVLEAERQAASLAAAERRAQQDAARRHGLLVPVAQRLLDCRDSLDDDADVTYWLDEIAAVLPSCQTPTQVVSLETYVKAVVRELGKAAFDKAGSAGAAVDAKLAYAAAAELVTAR